MNFVEREHGRLAEQIRSTPSNHPDFLPLMAAKGALAWVMEPDMFSRPMEAITGISPPELNGTGLEKVIVWPAA